MDPKILKQQQKAYNKAYGAFKRAHRLNLFEWIVVRIYLICYLARRLAGIIKAELTALKNKISPQTPPTEEDLISISWPEREYQKERDCEKEREGNTLKKFRAELLLFGQKVSSRLKIIIKNFIAAGKKVVNFIMNNIIKKVVATVTKIIKIVSKFISSHGIFFFLLVSVIILSCIINHNERELKMQQLRYNLLVSDSGKIQGPVLHVSNFHLENLINGTTGNNIVYNRTRHGKINDSINSIINQNTNSIINTGSNSNPKINTTGQGAIEVTQETIQENIQDSSSLIVTSPASIEGTQQEQQQEQYQEQEQQQEQPQYSIPIPTSMVPVAVRKEFIWNKVFELTSTPGGRFENFFIIRTQDRTFQPQREMLYEVIIEGYYDTLLYIGGNGSNGSNGKRVTQKDLLAARDVILSECESFALSAVGYWRDEGFLSTDIVVNFLDEYDTENVMYVYKNGVLNYSRYDTQIKELEGYDENDDMYIEDGFDGW